MVLNVAYSSDDNYLKHVMASLLSLLDHNREFEVINVYLLCNGIEETNRQELIELVKNTNANIHFLELSSVRDRIRTDGSFSISSFGRLFLGELVPERRIIYMDCDSIVNGSLMPLVQMDMGECICGAVQDNVSKYFKVILGNTPDSRYFNAGFLVIDLSKWNALQMQDKAIAVIEEFHGSVPHQDQGVLNKICYGKIMRLHPKYNFQSPMFEMKPEHLNKLIPDYYSGQELKEAKESPVFIHFTEGFSNRPWRKGCTHPYADLYRRYLDMTPYKGYIEDTRINKNAEIVKWFYYNTPFPVYRLFCKLIEIRKEFYR